MATVRDTIDPLNEREVSDEEALDLDRMGILLTGTRAKTPEGLRAAAVRQVTEQLEGTAAATAPAVVIGVGDPADAPTEDDVDEDQDDVDDEDSGSAPVSTTGDTPTSTTNQES